uniref:Uncharacterized protein n=1 Tax=viral metagenome TaxID=1070528 RepID=A0A6H1ZMG2_9ZZZZ
MEQKVLDDLQEAADKVKSVGDLLNRLYYSSDLSTIFIRPLLSMLIAATVYLADNLLSLKEKYARGIKR